MKTPTNPSIVVCYHQIVPEPFAATDNPRYSTEVGRFRRHLEALARKWSIVSLHALVDQLARGSLRPGQAAVTLDDGYADNYRYAFPVLQDLAIPATIFLITSNVGRDTPWWRHLTRRVKTATGGALRLPHELGDRVVDLRTEEQANRADRMLRERLRAVDVSTRDRILDALDMQPPRLRRYLSWEDVARMHRRGIAFGAHTHSHPYLVDISDGALREEILQSRDLIAAHLGSNPPIFAYPYGEVDARVARAVEDAGFSGAVTTRHVPCSSASSRYLLPRVCVGNWERDVFEQRLDEVCGSRTTHRVRRAYRAFRSEWERDVIRRRLDVACRRHTAIRILRSAYRSLKRVGRLKPRLNRVTP